MPFIAAKPKLLLHACCGPCSLTVLERVLPAYDVLAYFYNPNIQPHSEYLLRRVEFSKTAGHFGVAWVEEEYDMRAWFQRIQGFEKELERGERCRICIAMRLERAFQYARQNRFQAVASSLAISPYKDWPQIFTIGNALSISYGIAFLADNFRAQDGYAAGRKKARAWGIGVQNYCGCVFSKLDRLLRQRKAK